MYCARHIISIIYIHSQMSIGSQDSVVVVLARNHPISTLPYNHEPSSTLFQFPFPPIPPPPCFLSFLIPWGSISCLRVMLRREEPDSMFFVSGILLCLFALWGEERERKRKKNLFRKNILGYLQWMKKVDIYKIIYGGSGGGRLSHSVCGCWPAHIILLDPLFVAITQS